MHPRYLPPQISLKSFRVRQFNKPSVADPNPDPDFLSNFNLFVSRIMLSMSSYLIVYHTVGRRVQCVHPSHPGTRQECSTIPGQPLSYICRRRIKTEEKAKVVTADWGVQIQMNSSWRNSSYSSYRPTTKQRKELNKFCPLNKSDDLCLFFCSYPSTLTFIV